MKIVRQSKNDLKQKSIEKEIVIMGAGAITLRLLCAVDIKDRVKFICDDEESRIGGNLCGIPIVPFSELTNVNSNNVAIVISYRDKSEEKLKILEEYGDFEVYFSRTLVNETFEIVSCQLFDRLDDVNKVKEMLIDDTSKKIYWETVKRRILFGETNFGDLMIPGDAEYILPQMFSEELPSDEVIVDCGAYTGDTLEIFVKEFNEKLNKIWAFECGEEQLSLLKSRASKMKNLPYCPEIEIMPYGVSNKAEELEFFIDGALHGSFVLQNREFAKNDKYNCEVIKIKTVALDEVLPIDEKITMIKMDIEGSEYPALIGASNIIKKYKPKLMISLYHSGEDYTRIPLLLKELVPEYKFAVRHHKKRHVDTDLYAWI